MTLLNVAISWCKQLRETSPVDDSGLWPALRREWSDGGHDYVAFGLDQTGAVQWAVAGISYWRTAPTRPARYSPVKVTWRQFLRHHGEHGSCCTSVACPALDTALMWIGGAW